jgi:2-aminoethylphosphonate-pyruvate transaminase
MQSDKKLFTPGPLTTSMTVKQAMLHDIGSRDTAFINTIADVRSELLRVAGADPQKYETILMQGSGTFGVESVIGSAIPENGRLLVIINGAYGRRIQKIAHILHIPCDTLEYPENQIPDVGDIDQFLQNNPAISHVALIHCETTTGILNPVQAAGHVVASHNRVFIVDAMSSFGAIPISMADSHIHYLISSSNKCIEGVPGFSFIIAERLKLETCRGQARSLSLDLYDQWVGLNKDGQFRFTPPTHGILAFQQALRELEDEGGVNGRGKRYKDNQIRLAEGMRSMGIETYIDENFQSPIITTFLPPDHPRYDFETIYTRLNEKGFVIYPGKLTDRVTFRLGTVGRLYSEDIDALLEAFREVLIELEIIGME